MDMYNKLGCFYKLLLSLAPNHIVNMLNDANKNLWFVAKAGIATPDQKSVFEAQMFFISEPALLAAPHRPGHNIHNNPLHGSVLSQNIHKLVKIEKQAIVIETEAGMPH